MKVNKMKAILWVVMIFSLDVGFNAHAAPTAASDGSGLRGGGQTVDVSGRPRLRELVDRSSACVTKGLAREAVKNPFFSRYLKALSEVHWYFADAIEREAKRLNLCRLQNLIPLPESDWDQVTIHWDRSKRQVAIRLNQMVFLDDRLFMQMPEEDQALLFIHEIMHSFIPLNVERRQHKVRSMTLLVHENFTKGLSAETLALNLEVNDMLILPYATQLDAIRTLMRDLLGEGASIYERLRALGATNLEDIRLLTWADREAIWNWAWGPYNEARKAVENRKISRVTELLKNGVSPFFRFYDGKNLLTLASEAYNSDSEIVELLAHPERPFGNHSTRSEDANRILFEVISGRIQVQDLGRIFAMKPDPNALVTIEWGRQMMTLLSAAVVRGQWEIVSRLSEVRPIDPDTLSWAWIALLERKVDAADEIAMEWLVSSKIGVNQKLATREWPLVAAMRLDRKNVFQKILTMGANLQNTLVPATVEAARVEYLDLILATGRVDVNQKEAGLTPFEHAVKAKNALAAAHIASQPTFVFEPGSSLDADGAAWMLEQFCELNQPEAVSKLLAKFHFGWFTLFPQAEMARIKGYKDLEKILKKAME